MISEFKTIPKAVYYVQTADGCTVLDPDGDTLAEITAPGGYFPGIAAADGGPGTVTFSAPVKRVVGPFDLAPQLLLTLLGQLGGNAGDNGGLPAGYKRVEYLESTGTQVIDTGLKMDSYNQEVHFKLTGEGDKTRSTSAFGVWDSSPDLLYLFKLYQGSYRDWQPSFNGYWGEQYNRPLKEPTEIKVKTTEEKQGILCINGSCFSIEGLLFSLSLWTRNNVALFGVCTNYNFSPQWIGRFYYITFIKEGNIIGDFVPCLSPTGQPGMYDKVSGTFFTNIGSGDFLYPTESTTYSLRRVLPDWGKLTEHGLRRLYHAPAGWQGELLDYALEHGYKPIIEPEKPEDGYWAPRWRETADEIVLEWVETEQPADEFGLPDATLTNN